MQQQKQQLQESSVIYENKFVNLEKEKEEEIQNLFKIYNDERDKLEIKRQSLQKY